MKWDKITQNVISEPSPPAYSRIYILLMRITWRWYGVHHASMTHNDRTLSLSRMNHVSPDQPPSFAIPPRTSPVNPDLNPLENDCATPTTYTVMQTIFSPQKNSIPMGNISPIGLQGECFQMENFCYIRYRS